MGGGADRDGPFSNKGEKNVLWPIHSIHSGGKGEGGGSYSGI